MLTAIKNNFIPQINQNRTKSVNFGSKATDIAELTKIVTDKLELSGMELGLPKPVAEMAHPNENLTVTDAIKILFAKIDESTKITKELIFNDVLTGLYNRKAYDRDRSVLVKQAIAGGDDFGLIHFDLDNFKSYNDSFGHPEGDVALKVFASVIKEAVGECGKVYRVGGEELSVLVPDTDYKKIAEIAEKARKLLETESINKYQEGILKRPLTVSGGFHVFHPDEKKPLEVIADKALYVAKAKGRNRTIGINDIPVQLSLFQQSN